MSKSMSVLNPSKSNPNDDEDGNHKKNTHCPGTPRFGQDPELSSYKSEEAINSEEAIEALGEILGLIQPQTDRTSAPQGATATAMPQPQFTGQVHNHSVVEDNEGYIFRYNHTFGPYARNQNFNCNPNQTFGPQVQNPNQTFGPQSQNLGHNPNRTFGPHAQNQNVSQNPNQTFGPHGQSQTFEYKHGDQHGDSCSSCPPSDTSSNIIWEDPVACPEAYTTVERDGMIDNLVELYNANEDVNNRLRVLKIIEDLMLKNEAMARFLIREDFCQALNEDIGTLVKISVNSDKHNPDTEECLIYDRKLQARIKKAAIGQKNEDMVRKIFRKNDRNLSLLARVYGDASKKS